MPENVKTSEYYDLLSVLNEKNGSKSNLNCQ